MRAETELYTSQKWIIVSLNIHSCLYAGHIAKMPTISFSFFLSAV